MRKNNRLLPRSAFTLIELLVVTVIMSIVCLALYSTFASGARIWQRVNRMSLNEDVNIFFDRFAGDVSNGIVYTGLRFQGKADRFEIPTLVASPSLGAKTVGMVVYACGETMVMRSQADYSQVYQGATVHPRHSLGGLSACNFTYYRYDKEKDAYFWTEDWAGEGLPVAVRMELVLGEGDSAMPFVKTVSLPLGQPRRGNDE